MTDPTPDGRARTPVTSYALLGEAIRARYFGYYKHVFRDGALDLRTKELIALAVSLVTGAPNCVEGHLAKCVELGVTREQIEDVVATTMGVVSASVVDRADIGFAGARQRIDAAFAAQAAAPAVGDSSAESDGSAGNEEAS